MHRPAPVSTQPMTRDREWIQGSPHWPTVEVSHSCAGDTRLASLSSSRFLRGDFFPGRVIPAPSVIGSALGLVGPVLV